MGRLSECVRKVSCLNECVDLHPAYKRHCEGKNIPYAFIKSNLFFCCDVLYVFNVDCKLEVKQKVIHKAR